MYKLERMSMFILSDCNFYSSAGEVSGTQGIWEGGGWAGTSVRDPESQEKAPESLNLIDILFWFFHY